MTGATIRRIAVLTGGGDCPGLNAVIRGAVKGAHFEHNIKVVGIEDGYAGLVEKRYRLLHPDDVSGILYRGGTILGTSNRDNPFKYFTDAKGNPVSQGVDRSEEAIANLTEMGAEALIAIGGDGSLTIAYELSQKGVPVVGVPKTIDNDLGATDVTFGFDTAITTATEAIDKLHTTAESHHRVMILEVMGRYAGWIALHSGIAGGGDVILIPEIPYDMDRVCAAILERKKQGKKSSIVVVAEGAKPKGGEMVVAKVVKDSPDPLRLGGIGNKVGEEIEKRTGIETRTTVLGHVQRGGSPTPYDRILGTRFGVEAVRQVVARNFGTMVALRGADIVAVPILEAVGKLRKVDPEGELVKVAREVGTSFGD